MRSNILAIDDDVSFLNFLKENLIDKGYNTVTASDPSTAKTEIESNNYDCILLDVRIPGVNGLELLKLSLKNNSTIPVVMVSGQSSISIAVEALKIGAFDFIEKPIDISKLEATIKNAVTKKILSNENEILFSEIQKTHKMIGKSTQFENIIHQINSIAKTNAKVLIQGETGTGKELVAWAIHHNSERKSKPYIKINCAAIPSELLESELFGYKKGTFTGADSDKEGKFIAANGGTLFLDEIGDMSLALQSKILRVLEENEVDILGKNEPTKIDVRILAATNQDLEEKVASGEFRNDLYYRLKVVNIFIPPLCERIDDIHPIAYHYLKQFCEVYNKRILGFQNSAEQLLLNYTWPGNVRELKNVIENIVIHSNDEHVSFNEVSNAIGQNVKKNIDIPSEDINLKEAKKEFEKKFIINKLKSNNYNISKTAEEIGIDRSNLFRKIQKLGIRIEDKK